MYRLEKNYKIELKKADNSQKPVYYTGIIKEEDETHIRIQTIKGEELVISKDEIRQCKLVEDSIGFDNEQRKGR